RPGDYYCRTRQASHRRRRRAGRPAQEASQSCLHQRRRVFYFGELTMPGSTTARPLAELANFSDGAAASFPYVIGIMACQNKDFEILKGLRLSRWFPDFLIHTTQTAIRTATMAKLLVFFLCVLATQGGSTFSIARLVVSAP